MSIRNEFDQIIKEVRNILIGHPDYYEFPSIKAEIELFSRNLKETIDFLDHDCTKDQLAWMSDVFGQISANLKSWEFADALYRAAKRLFKKTDRDLFIKYRIPDAERGLPMEIYRQRFPDCSENDGSKSVSRTSFKQELAPIVKLHKIYDKENLSDRNWPDYRKTSPIIMAEIAVLSRNLQDTVNFLDHDCTGEQLKMIGKVCEDVSAKLKSWEFIDAMKRAAEKFPRIPERYGINDRILDAVGFLPDEIYFQRFPNESKMKRAEIQSNICFKRYYEEIIRKKEHISAEHPEYFELPPHLAEIALLSRNLQDTVNFLDHDCTGEQLVWMSEVFEEVSANLKSWEFIDALTRAADRFPKACSEYNIRNCIEYAIGVLPDEVYGQRFPDGSEDDNRANDLAKDENARKK